MTYNGIKKGDGRVNRLKMYRVGNNLNQGDVAKALGIARGTYCLKEQGKIDFTQTEINKILKLLNMKYEEIFF